MPNILKCPAPTCSFRFDASLVPANAVIACPQCRLQFTLGPNTAPPHVAAAPEPDDEPTYRRRKKAAIATRPEKGTTSNQGLLIALVVVGMVILAVGGFFLIGNMMGMFRTPTTGPKVGSGPGAKFENYGITIPSPPDGWEKNDSARTAFGNNLLVYARKNPEAWMAFEARKVDFAAKETELKPKMMERLKARFTELDETLEPQADKLMGFAAQKYEFGGIDKLTGNACRGEVYACVTKNYMYWMYAWWPKDDFADHGSIDVTRNALEFNGGSSLTTKTKAPEKTFRSRGGLYQLADTEGLWIQQPDPTIFDAKADLYLKGLGKNPATGKPSSEQANLAVVVLKAEGTAKEQAVAHILKQYTTDPVVTELNAPSDAEAPVSGEVTPADNVARFTLTYPGSDASANMLVVYSVIDVNDQRIVAYADAGMKQKSYWEQRLMLILGTLANSK